VESRRIGLTGYRFAHQREVAGTELLAANILDRAGAAESLAVEPQFG
jgi:hypothetical protein